MKPMPIRALPYILPLVLLSCATAAQAEPLTIRVGFAGIGAGGRENVSGIAGLVAAEKYLEREFADRSDIHVQWFYFRGAGPATNEALANDQLDFAYMGDLPSLTARAIGLKTRILMAAGGRDNLYLVVPTASPIRSIEDLKGHKVAQFRGTSTHLTTERVLTARGLADRDFQFINMDDPTALAALAAGEVDGGFGKAVLLTLVDQGLARIAFTTKGDPSTVTSNHLLVTERFEQAHPDLTQRIVTATLRASDWASDETHREALFGIWAKSGTPIGVFRADYAGQTLNYRTSPLLDDLAVETYRYKAVQVKALGLVRRDVDIAGWFDTVYLDRALKDLKLENHWARYDAEAAIVPPTPVTQ
ncbi:MAG TPA: ABC transporter substrate-binding protein [Aliidongia sp.]|uniref:ABC transporter substrate-binding protein n=1 Tax=Aliidongia sp. TaxID=1914230 RepID=UPI002DDD6E9B|nr:ABC transporter substrate-binding protein [Aliidongia sp.]HEV2674761.1 ABC transporter substrate-binding protein [Aliidongia sp.]